MNITYKLGRVITMTLPFILSILFVVHTVLNYNGKYIDALNYIGGTSYFLLLYLYIMSRVYKLCEHHRMFIYYLFTVNTLCIYDVSYHIPISDKTFLLGIVLSFGICVIIYGILIFKHNKHVKVNS